jgi:hypothetical protein
MAMKTFIFISLLATLLFPAFSVNAAPAPFSSKEEIEYTSKTEQKFLDLLKTPEFEGVITRTSEPNRELQLVDFYDFKNVQEVAMTKELCKKLLAKIYGPLNEISLKVRDVQIFTSHTGNTCEAQIDNDFSKARIRERRTIIGFLNAKPYGLVFKFSRKSVAAEQENAKKFWDSLR